MVGKAHGAITNKTTPESGDRFYLTDNADGLLRDMDYDDLKAGIGSGLFMRWIPASEMYPTVTAGCGTLASTETTATRPDIRALPFDGTSQEYAQCTIAMPKRWNEGTITVRFLWSTTNAATNGVRWGAQAVAAADNDTIDVAFGTAIEVTDNNQGAAEDLLRSAETAAITVAGTPAAGETTFIQVYRDPTHGDDDMTQDALLIGVELYWTANAATDD